MDSICNFLMACSCSLVNCYGWTWFMVRQGNIDDAMQGMQMFSCMKYAWCRPVIVRATVCMYVAGLFMMPYDLWFGNVMDMHCLYDASMPWAILDMLKYWLNVWLKSSIPMCIWFTRLCMLCYVWLVLYIFLVHFLACFMFGSCFVNACVAVNSWPSSYG